MIMVGVFNVCSGECPKLSGCFNIFFISSKYEHVCAQESNFSVLCEIILLIVAYMKMSHKRAMSIKIGMGLIRQPKSKTTTSTEPNKTRLDANFVFDSSIFGMSMQLLYELFRLFPRFPIKLQQPFMTTNWVQL